MALKTFKPTTPSQRQLVLVDRSHLWKGKPVKALTEGLTKSGGRHPVTPWGKSTKGKKTRHNRSTDQFILRSRHQKKG